MEEINQTLTPEERLRAEIASRLKFEEITKAKESSSGKNKIKSRDVVSSDISPYDDPLPSHGIKLEEQPVAPEGNLSPKGGAFMLFASLYQPEYTIITDASGNQNLIGVLVGPDCTEYGIVVRKLPPQIISNDEVDDPIPGVEHIRE
ncbi:hypothetical protein OROGR_020089 [Orobanche gracilis]